MDQYKISQSRAKKILPKQVKSLWPTKRQIKTIDNKLAFGVVGGALGLIIIGALIAVFTLSSNKAPKALPTAHSGSLTTSHVATTTIPSATFNALTTAVTNKNLSILGSYCAPTVHVIIVKTGVNETLSCAKASQLLSTAINGATNPWNFHLSESNISAWQTGPYGSDFTGTNIVGESANGDVISIGFNSSGQVTTVTVVPVSSLTPPTGSSTSTTPSNTGSSTTTPPSNGSVTNDIPAGNPKPIGAID